MSIEYQKNIDQLAPWFHNVHLPDGTETYPEHPLGDFPYFKWEKIQECLPKDLNNWTVLDIGCNAGFYSFELAQRGAFVTAIDIDDHYLNQAQWLAEVFKLTSKIKFINAQVYELSSCKLKYDLVWYMGVSYHLRYPLLALDILSRITKNTLVFQTMTFPDKCTYDEPFDVCLNDRHILGMPGWPKMAFVERSLAGDPTNWWVPNTTAVKEMLRASGFTIVSNPTHEVYLCNKNSIELIPKDDIRDIEYHAATGQSNKHCCW